MLQHIKINSKWSMNLSVKPKKYKTTGSKHRQKSL